MKYIQFQPKIVQCLRHYNKQKFTADLMAGIIVGIVALPLAIAFAIASGVSPEKGIITAIVAGLAISAFGGSRVQIGGPTGAFIIIIYGIIQQYGLEGLAIATVLAGLFLILLGITRLGTIIRYIPYPIVVGFTSGIALTIFTTQIKDLFGLQIAGEVPADFISKWVVYAHNFSTVDLATTLVGVFSVVIIAVMPMVSKKVPGSLVAIIVMTLAGIILTNHFGIHVFDLALEIFVQVDICLALQDIAELSAENVGYVEVAVILGLCCWKSVFAEVFQCLTALGKHKVGVGLAELLGATFKDVYVFFIDVHVHFVIIHQVVP